MSRLQQFSKPNISIPLAIIHCNTIIFTQQEPDRFVINNIGHDHDIYIIPVFPHKVEQLQV